MDKDTASLIEQIRELDTDSFFLLFYIIATVIGIERNFLSRDAIISNTKPDYELLKKLDISVPAILLIARSYFLYQNILDYKENPNQFNLNYVIVALLVFFAALIDLYTIIIEPASEEPPAMF